MFKAIKYGGASPMPLIRWTIAERFGWTLDYIDGLSVADLHEFFAVEEGRDKARPTPKPKGKR